MTTIVRAARASCLCMAAALHAQSTTAVSDVSRARGAILGAVTDTALSPIPDADIEFIGTPIQVKSNASGRFLVTSLPPGSYIVIARRVAFQPSVNVADVRAGDTLRLAFLLAPSATELSPVMVTERSASPTLREFEERRAKGVGEFFTQEQIESRNVQGVIDLLRESKTVWLKPGIGGVSYVANSGRNHAFECRMQIYLDGIPLPGNTDIMTLPSPKEIMGIEIYAGAATTPIWLPFERRMGANDTAGWAGCGVIMLWTRDGSKGE